ncbi:pseudouridine-5'-phosphate glycosidase-like [Diabrotica undecimpunctata]|uniref:pseudouridine-5'-phosphate glycosidase-like n=1 Tax=Diabrotica undecimpunctata TaxID=50387 RepID=UPI003B63D48E
MFLRRSSFFINRTCGVFANRTVSQSCIQLSEELKNAFTNRLPVVALESTIITHGMPYPQNVECALQVEEVIRKQGAVPATIAIVNGKIKVGLSEKDINKLGDTKSSQPIKTSRRDLAYVMSNKKNGGTTVSGTLIVANKVNIPIFATGGIGGVHRDAENTFDISADLIELGRSSVAVISSGVKSILDIPKTLEVLETQGVFVATFGSPNDFPAFYARDSGIKVPYSVQNADEAARIIKSNRDINTKSGMLFGVPIPEEFAFDSDVINKVIEEALHEAKLNNIQGKLITPFLLSHIAKITEGKSLQSNIALIKNNAKVAADIAVALSKLEQSQVEDKGTSIIGENIQRRPIIIGGSNMDCSAVLDTDNIQVSTYCTYRVIKIEYNVQL